MQFRSVTVLGLLGLAPFFFFAILILKTPHDTFALKGFYEYSAIVLSFLGGTHWGVLAQARSVGQTSSFRLYWLWSIFPPFVAWLVLWFPPTWQGIVALIFMNILQYAMDVRLTKLNILPFWLLQLRRVLTLLAMLAFLAVLVRLLLI
jgi:hypothetical protein